MTESMSLISEGGGRFLWSLGNRRISWGDDFNVWSPVFTFSSFLCWIHLWKNKQSIVIGTTLYIPVVPSLRFSLESALLADGESASGVCSVAEQDRAPHYVEGVMSIRNFLWKRTHRTFDGPVALQFRMSAEPRGAGPEVAEGTGEDLEEDSENESFKKLQEDLERLLSSETDSDVTLMVEDNKFPAHRAILRTRSPVFEAMFRHDMVERRSREVTIGDCDPETFPDFLRYIYTGSTEHVSWKNVCHLYTASDKYEVLSLKQKCVGFMKRHVSAETFCDTITFALKHADEGLLRSTTAFFCANAAEILKTAKWQTFLAENPTVGNDLFLEFCQRK